MEKGFVQLVDDIIHAIRVCQAPGIEAPYLNNPNNTVFDIYEILPHRYKLVPKSGFELIYLGDDLHKKRTIFSDRFFNNWYIVQHKDKSYYFHLQYDVVYSYSNNIIEISKNQLPVELENNKPLGFYGNLVSGKMNHENKLPSVNEIGEILIQRIENHIEVEDIDELDHEVFDFFRISTSKYVIVPKEDLKLIFLEPV